MVREFFIFFKKEKPCFWENKSIVWRFHSRSVSLLEADARESPVCRFWFSVAALSVHTGDRYDLSTASLHPSLHVGLLASTCCTHTTAKTARHVALCGRSHTTNTLYTHCLLPLVLSIAFSFCLLFSSEIVTLFLFLLLKSFFFHWFLQNYISRNQYKLFQKVVVTISRGEKYHLYLILTGTSKRMRKLLTSSQSNWFAIVIIKSFYDFSIFFICTYMSGLDSVTFSIIFPWKKK